jgi:serine/threonine protein kinase
MLLHGVNEGDESVTVLRSGNQDYDVQHETHTSDASRKPGLLQGTRLGVFQIRGRLGGGGQGDVYQAHDSRLGREVAIKVLAGGILRDPERLARFEQEARILASLNHPHIGAVYELREEDHLHFLVLELVAGETLSDRIVQGPIPVKEVLGICIPIAEALEAAHERGIIHRDLKPANIMLNAKGGVKVLDFGIAKALELKPCDRSDEPSRPIAKPQQFATGDRILGTPAYMSPEQMQGLAVDCRTDIWAFGILIQEMLTGQNAFQTYQVQKSAYCVVQQTPHSVAQYCPNAPPRMVRMLERALQTNPEDRYQNMTELLAELREICHAMESGRVRVGDLPNAIPSVAILPFVNIDGEPSSDYFSDGLAEELICGLSRLPGLRVVARSSAFRFRGKDLDIRDVGRQLGVSSVLEGSVRKAGKRLRVTVKLVSAVDGYHLWSERYDREVNDLFAIQEEMAVAIVNSLKSEILEEERARLSVRNTSSLEAHDLYLKGRYHQNSISHDRLAKAIDYYRLALVEDPGYALAYAGLTECYCLLGLWGFIDPKEAVPEAKVAALKALALDETLAEVHHALGLVRSFCGEWSTARMEFKRAIELRPDHAFGRACHAMYLRFTADRDRALAEMSMALDLEPHSVGVNAGAAYLLFSLRHYDEAIRQCQRVLVMEPNFFQAHGYLAFAYARLGMLEESVAEWRALLSQRGYQRIAWGVQRAFERSGYRGAMLKIAQRSVVAYYLIRMLHCIPRRRRRYCTPMLPAVLFAEAGETESAFKWLNRAYAQRTPLMIGLAEDPPWDGLRVDPRFEVIISKIAGNQA